MGWAHSVDLRERGLTKTSGREWITFVDGKALER